MLFHKIKYYGFMMLRSSCTNNNCNLELSRSFHHSKSSFVYHLSHSAVNLGKKNTSTPKKRIGTIGLFAPVVERLNEAIHQINQHPMY